MTKAIFTPGQRKAVAWLVGALLSFAAYLFGLAAIDEGIQKIEMTTEMYDMLLKFIYISLGLLFTGNVFEYFGSRRGGP